LDIALNSATQDYTLNAGRLAHDAAAGLANAVYLRLMTPLGSYWAEPALGSRLHELAREKDLPRVARLASQYAEQALAPLLADGRVSRVQVETERLPGRLNLIVTLTTAAGQPLLFTHPVAVG
jgi:phage gp46-like protein